MRAFVLDTLERAFWTFLQTFLATISLTDVSTVRTAAIAGAAAVLSVVKSAAASRVHNTLSPASVIGRE